MKVSALRIAAPCPEDWGSMTGDARERWCARCDHPVQNLSELREADAEALVARRGAGVCLRAAHDAAGNIVSRTTQERRFLSALQALAARRGESPA